MTITNEPSTSSSGSGTVSSGAAVKPDAKDAPPPGRTMPLWVKSMIERIEAAPTIGKSLSVLFECVATEGHDNDKGPLIGDLLQNGNAITAAVVKHTAAHSEPIA